MLGILYGPVAPKVDKQVAVGPFPEYAPVSKTISASLVQIAAEELGVSEDAIDLVKGDTDTVPFDHGDGGSRYQKQSQPVWPQVFHLCSHLFLI